MKNIIFLIIILTNSTKLCSQPGDHGPLINSSACTQPFLHGVNEEKYFAKYAVEAHQYGFEMLEHIKCKLQIPAGINKVWQDIEKRRTINHQNAGDDKRYWSICANRRQSI